MEIQLIRNLLEIVAHPSLLGIFCRVQSVEDLINLILFLRGPILILFIKVLLNLVLNQLALQELHLAVVAPRASILHLVEHSLVFLQELLFVHLIVAIEELQLRELLLDFVEHRQLLFNHLFDFGSII